MTLAKPEVPTLVRCTHMRHVHQEHALPLTLLALHASQARGCSSCVCGPAAWAAGALRAQQRPLCGRQRRCSAQRQRRQQHPQPGLLQQSAAGTWLRQRRLQRRGVAVRQLPACATSSRACSCSGAGAALCCSHQPAARPQQQQLAGAGPAAGVAAAAAAACVAEATSGRWSVPAAAGAGGLCAAVGAAAADQDVTRVVQEQASARMQLLFCICANC